MARRLLLGLFLLASPAMAAPCPVCGSEPPVPGAAPSFATITGMVIDALTERPLPGALVTVWPVGERWARGEPQEIRTDAQGRYRAHGLAGGTYLVRVRAIGFRPAELTVYVSDEAAYDLSVGLQVQPVRLQPVAVIAPPPTTFGMTLTSELDAAARMHAHALARRRYLTPETRVLTAADVREAVTFGEFDVIRALQRSPGVSARDEYSAALWTRGAPWSQTLVTIDGMPLFNGMHAAGLVSAVNPDAVGAATFHPGVQPAAGTGGAAGLVELETRRGTMTGRPRFVGDLSLLAARGAIDLASAGDRTAAMVALRRSHLDLSPPATRFLRRMLPDEVPYAFSDVTARLDQRIGSNWTLDVSALASGDRLWGEVSGLVERTTGTWGGLTAQASLRRQVGKGMLRHTIGYSAFGAEAESRDTTTAGRLLPGYEGKECACLIFNEAEFIGQPTDNRIGFAVGRVAWEGLDASSMGLRSAGVEVTTTRARYRTRGAWPLTSTPGAEVVGEGEHRQLAAWIEHGVDRGWVAARAGTRLERTLGPGTGRAVRLAPRLSTRFVAGPTSLSATWGRTYQAAQTIAPPGFGRNAVATSDMFWIVADGGQAPLRSDLVSVAGEWQPDSATTLGATWYRRRSTDVAVADPMPGRRADRALYVLGELDASGIELWARRFAGPVTSSLAYSRGTSTIDAGGMTYLAPWERRHVVRMGASATTSRGVRGAAQFTYGTGAPFTRIFFGAPICDGGQCRWAVAPQVDSASAGRGESLRGLDLAVDYTRRFGAVRTQVYLQAHNALQSASASAYLQSYGWCSGAAQRLGRCDVVTGRWQRREDVTLPALPRVVTAGVRVAY